MGEGLTLDAAAWAGIVVEDGEARDLGAAADARVIPANLRRRMPAFARDVVRCAWRLVEEAPQSEIVFASRYADLASTAALLTDLARETLLSPSAFSHSVHNAPPGLASLCLGVTAGHTAIAGGRDCLVAGLTEAFARLASAPAGTEIVLLYADVALPPPYEAFDEGGPDVHLGLRLALPSGAAGEPARVGADRAGAAALAAALEGGARRLVFAPPTADGGEALAA